MAILSAFTMIRSLAIVHITLAYFIFTSPQMLADQNIVVLLGEAMHLPRVSGFNKTSPATAMLAVVFALLGLSDLTSAALSDHIAYEYWLSQTPIRLLFLFGLTSYTYVSKPASAMPFGTSKFYQTPAGDNLKNGLVFTWSFLEMVFWFMVFLALREERKSLSRRKVNPSS
ncbi:hypothetical protein BT63DRAFT_416355 [Microthyrium microscopicum]|uniref:Increased loss of mitochondrial DNA protein 1 n=1 Tax=Microthyrium microscopicum TaxID=703497 RepID=A0A6A6U2T5_9PEZI|nr:hypothetical protein BT63DRAFT_416355 [Microthyrium microscopicum]